ncbi:MAG: hypothetical protein JKY48_19385, partial [Flavobacteriales bacterium]|nr:hypothetical protein [Flavobacteriales bacterium]
PSVLIEDAAKYFQLKQSSPYMLLTCEIDDKLKEDLPPNYYELDLKDRLYQVRSEFQSITHLDFSARVQTVSKDQNKVYWELLQEMKKQSGAGMLVNTSFNVRGEPIVNTPLDAYRCFMNTDMDILVMNNFIFIKEIQPDWENKSKWNQQFKKD